MKATIGYGPVLLAVFFAVGCAHQAPKQEATAVVPPPACVDASQPALRLARAELEVAKDQLKLYQLVADLSEYVNSSDEVTASPEQMIEEVETARSNRSMPNRLNNEFHVLRSKARLRYAKMAIARLKDYRRPGIWHAMTAKDAIVIALDAVSKRLGEEGNTELIAQIRELAPEARMSYAKKLVNRLREEVDDSKHLMSENAVADTEAAIAYALHEGDDVAALAATMVKIRKDHCTKEIVKDASGKCRW